MIDTKKPNILQRLNAVMKEVDYLQKGEKPINGQYRAVTHDAVTKKVHEPFVKNGIFAAFKIKSRTQNGNRTEIDACVTFINIDDPSDKIEVDSVGYGIDSQDKGPGKAISYAYKYAILKALCIETGDDPDLDQVTEFSDKVEIAASVPKPQSMIGTIFALTKGDTGIQKYIMNHHKVQNLIDMSPQQMQEAIDWLQKQKNVKVG